MLQFSFSTVLMALLASNIIAILIAIAFLKRESLLYVGYESLALFVALALFRLLLPIEFPFTSNVLLPEILSKILSSFQRPQFYIAKIGISFWNIFELVWVIGIIVKLLYSVWSYRHAQNYIKRKGVDKTETPKYKLLLDEICFQHHKNNNFHVIELPSLAAPVIWGAKEPCIILPSAIDIPSDKLYYILYHETLHYFRHDLFVKKAIHFLAIIYWWNPACVILHKRSNLLFEMYVDRAITKENPDIIQEYTECLLFIKKEAERISPQLSSSLEENVCSLIQPHDNDLEKRAIMLMKKPSVFQKVGANILLATFIICTLACSHLFILEAAYYPTYDDQIILNPTADNTFFIIDESSNYEVYINGIHMETTTSLEFYPKGIKIYNQKGELIGET